MKKYIFLSFIIITIFVSGCALIQKKQKWDDNSLVWKTYENKEYGFSFKYPESFILDVNDVEIQKEFLEENKPKRLVINFIDDASKQIVFGLVLRDANFYNNLPHYKDLNIYTGENIVDYCNSANTKQNSYYKCLVSGNERKILTEIKYIAIECSQSFSVSHKFSVDSNMFDFDIIEIAYTPIQTIEAINSFGVLDDDPCILKKEAYSYIQERINNFNDNTLEEGIDGQYFDITKDILLSFKELEENKLLDISTRKTYKNEEYGLSFEYPENWLLNFDGKVGGFTYSDRVNSSMYFDIILNFYPTGEKVPYLSDLDKIYLDEGNSDIKNVNYVNKDYVKFQEYNSHIGGYQFVEYHKCKNGMFSFTYFLDDVNEQVNIITKTIDC